MAEDEDVEIVWLPAETLIDQAADNGVGAPETFPEPADAHDLGPPPAAPDAPDKPDEPGA